VREGPRIRPPVRPHADERALGTRMYIYALARMSLMFVGDHHAAFSIVLVGKSDRRIRADCSVPDVAPTGAQNSRFWVLHVISHAGRWHVLVGGPALESGDLGTTNVGRGCWRAISRMMSPCVAYLDVPANVGGRTRSNVGDVIPSLRQSGRGWCNAWLHFAGEFGAGVPQIVTAVHVARIGLAGVPRCVALPVSSLTQRRRHWSTRWATRQRR
jgi:hypothetical protein